MKKLLFATTIIFLSVGITNTFAQSSIFNLTYNMGFPTGELQNYINKSSFRGFGFDGRGFISDNVSVGGTFSWAVFNEKTNRLEELEGGVDVSGVQFRYVNAFPLAANVHYYIGEPYETRFLFGAGLGAYRINQRTELGLVAVENNNWHFGFYPEAGVLVPVGSGNTGLYIGLKYQYAISNSKNESFSWLSLDIGISIIN